MHTHWNDDPIYIKDEDGKIKRWDFFGGNLQGIIAKLDYIQSLGVTAIYLNPIFQAESNHRYDTGDYHKVDPLLGTKEDLEKLLIEAGKRNIEIMLDGVFSHTGSNSLYFNQKGEYPSIGAYQSVESPYYSWYNFQHHPDLYDAWWGIETLPTLNKENESYQQFLIHNEDSVIKAWQKAGVKNWRLDVADELTDDLIKQIYQQLKKENSSSVLLGEVWEDASNKIAYGKRREYLLGGELDSVMNYPLRQFLLSFMNGEWNAHTLKRKLLTLYEHYPKQYFYATMNMLSNHDVERLKTVLDGFMSEKMPREEKNRRITEQIKALSLWIYTFPGVPSLYYGDEAGLTGGEDPDNRKPYPWGREEKELVTWYQTIGGWRREYSALRTGHWKPHVLHNDVLAFERWNANGRDAFGNNSNNEHFLYLMNRNLHEEVEITLPIRQGKWQHLLDYRMFHETVRISPCECMLLKLS
nr:glycoside hydrolase family 13 protein [Aquibacillus albus]